MKPFKFTQSKDGQLRTTVRVEFRLTKDQVEQFLRFADSSGFDQDKKSLASFLRSCVYTGIDTSFGEIDPKDK